MSAVIETKDLSKIYEGHLKGQDVHALKDLNLTVNRGEIYGYLGPNGSGKTTTIKLILGLIFPTKGSLSVLGRTDIGSQEVRRNIGYLPEGAYYPDFLKGEEVLYFYGRLYGLSGSDLKQRVDRALDTVGMTRARKRLIKGYSKGMRQRIGLAQAILSDPQLLILDEPTTGLDPIARKEIRDILVRLRDEGKTLLISSHELLEVELISNRVGILFEGDMKIQGTLDELLVNRDTAVHVRATSDAGLDHMRQKGITVEDAVKERAVLRAPTSMSLYQLIDHCKTEHMEVVSVAPRRETLEELFVRIVGSAAAKR